MSILEIVLYSIIGIATITYITITIIRWKKGKKKQRKRPRRMKLKEMYDLCDKQKGNCEKCPLNCIDNWQEEKLTWCLISLKKKYIEIYQDEVNKGNQVLADRIQARYEELEKQYIERNQNK